jgi:hypothetical protein
VLDAIGVLSLFALTVENMAKLNKANGVLKYKLYAKGDTVPRVSYLYRQRMANLSCTHSLK